MLMERRGCTADEAFDELRRGSQRENRKLTALAEDAVARRRTTRP
jgi:AmiR/NasT family two-component response regulator